MINILLYFCLLLFLFSCSQEEAQAFEIQFHTLDISAHLSLTSVCNRASTNGSKNRASSSTVLEVVHKHGPCAPKNTHNEGEDKEAKLPVQTGLSLGSGNYIVAIGFGTPARTLSLEIDTGSDLTWIQCHPCHKNCYQQKEPIFDPSASTTYSKIHCKSQECLELDKYDSGSGCDQKSTCLYGVQYGDGSHTSGFYSKDQLTVTPATDVFPGFQFGCGHNNTGKFFGTAGILALGRSPLSIVSQTEKKYSQVFSYCLPDIGSTGFLSFGGGKYNNSEKAMMITTPLVPAPQGYPTFPYYYIEITGISVGCKQLPITESVFTTAHAVVDSGTMITRLPPEAYTLMSAEYLRLMTTVLTYKSAPANGILDTCFYINNVTNITLPAVSITFRGNASKLHLDPSGILFVINSTQACLAFAGNTDPTDVAIFGNVQQRKFQVIFDLPGKKVVFRSNPNCKL